MDVTSTIKKVTHFFAVHKRNHSLKHKFLIVLLILTLYFFFASWHFGLKEGFLVMLLTWSFFVLATPIPDGGIILDLPLRYFVGLRMIISEIVVWSFAIVLNILSILFHPQVYEKTFLLTLLKDILTTPFPYGIIIILSCFGTFFSLYFGDELYDAISAGHLAKKHKRKYYKVRFFIMLGIIVFVVIIYELLLKHLGVKFI